MRPPEHCPILLEGIVGSQAYGLATATSDVDKLGIFARPTSDFWLLKSHPESYTHATDEPDDYCYHEAEKYVRLALKCNPTVLELLFLDHEYYTVQTSFSESLIWKRHSFLSQSYLHNSYLGYVTQQVKKIQAHSDSPRISKHARHVWRLCEQGAALWMTGSMSVKLEPFQAEICHEFGRQVADGNLKLLEDRIAATEAIFDNFRTDLPEEPDTDSVETWLVSLRRKMLVPETTLI
jgi:uncharacterized protein